MNRQGSLVIAKLRACAYTTALHRNNQPFVKVKNKAGVPGSGFFCETQAQPRSFKAFLLKTHVAVIKDKRCRWHTSPEA